MTGIFKKIFSSSFWFKEPENTACFICNHILKEKKSILLVFHEADGDWQFLCGSDNHSEDNIKIVSLKQVTKIDESVNQLFEMPLGYGAERASGHMEWNPFIVNE